MTAEEIIAFEKDNNVWQLHNAATIFNALKKLSDPHIEKHDYYGFIRFYSALPYSARSVWREYGKNFGELGDHDFYEEI